MVGEEVVISDSLVTHFARPVRVEVVGDPFDSTSGLGEEEGPNFTIYKYRST